MNIHCVLGIWGQTPHSEATRGLSKRDDKIISTQHSLHNYGASRWKLQLAENTSRVNHQHNCKIQSTLSPPPDTGEHVNQVTHIISSTLNDWGAVTVLTLGRPGQHWTNTSERLIWKYYKDKLSYFSPPTLWERWLGLHIKSNESYSTRILFSASLLIIVALEVCLERHIFH